MCPVLIELIGCMSIGRSDLIIRYSVFVPRGEGKAPWESLGKRPAGIHIPVVHTLCTLGMPWVDLPLYFG